MLCAKHSPTRRVLRVGQAPRFCNRVVALEFRNIRTRPSLTAKGGEARRKGYRYERKYRQSCWHGQRGSR
jgi:hypothetical protein